MNRSHRPLYAGGSRFAKRNCFFERVRQRGSVTLARNQGFDIRAAAQDRKRKARHLRAQFRKALTRHRRRRDALLPCGGGR